MVYKSTSQARYKERIRDRIRCPCLFLCLVGLLAVCLLVTVVVHVPVAEDSTHLQQYTDNNLLVDDELRPDLGRRGLNRLKKKKAQRNRIMSLRAQAEKAKGVELDDVEVVLSNKAMVYMEPRKIEMATYVLDNYNTLVPLDWDLIIMHSKHNRRFMEERVAELKGNRTVILKEVLPNAFSGKKYNQMFLNYRFWEHFDHETLLIFQSDSILCANSPFKLSQFEEYSYIGCAFGEHYAGSSHNDWQGYPFYGSGGLTIRNVNFHKQCIEDPIMQELWANGLKMEDAYFSTCLYEGRGHRPENATVLQQFCTQQGDEQPAIGVHKFWDTGYRYAPAQTQNILKHCPEALALHPEAPYEPEWNNKTIIPAQKRPNFRPKGVGEVKAEHIRDYDVL